MNSGGQPICAKGRTLQAQTNPQLSLRESSCNHDSDDLTIVVCPLTIVCVSVCRRRSDTGDPHCEGSRVPALVLVSSVPSDSNGHDRLVRRRRSPAGPPQPASMTAIARAAMATAGPRMSLVIGLFNRYPR